MTEQLGNYELTRLLARGGMGEVYLARQKGPAGFTREVVVKRLLPHLSADAQFVEQFLNEGQLAALIEHPNVAQVYELGEAQGTYFLAMEWVRGESLRRVLRALKARGAMLPVGASVHLACETLKGLHAAHALVRDGQPLTVVHRDMTPENLLLTATGGVKIVDFGIARASDSRRYTQTGTVKGKLPYLAPDLLLGSPASPRTDLYSVAVVLYELLTGTVPFEAESEGTLVYKVVYTPARPPSQLRPEVSPALEAVVLKSLSKDPQARYGDAPEFVAALKAAAAAELAALDLSALGAWAAGERAPDDPAAAPTQPVGRWLPKKAPAGGTQPLAVEPAPATPRRAARARWVAAPVVLAVLALGAWRAVQSAAPATPAPAVAATPAREAPQAVPVREPEPATEPVAPPMEKESKPAAEPTAAAPARRAPAKGRLQVFARPWAEVFWHGTRLGVTPLVEPVSLPVGTQVLTLRNAPLGVEKEFKVQIRAGSVAELRANLMDH